MTAVTEPSTPMWGTSQRTAAPPPTPLGSSLRRVGVVIVVTAVLIDLSIRTRAGGLAAMLAVWCLCLGLACTGRVVRRGGRVALGVAALLSGFLFVRASPWLLAIDLVAIVVLVALGCSAERSTRPFDGSATGFVRRLCATAVAILGVPPRAVRTIAALLPRGRTTTGQTTWQVLRGLLLAAPILVVIGIVLAWADPVFASMFDLDLHAAPVFVQLTIIVLAVWIVCGFFVQASRPPVAQPAGAVRIGAVEGLVVMAGLTLLYGVFAVSQLVVARRGADYVVARTGLTYAEYARSGFFQLLWVAAATVVVLVSLRATVRLETPRARRTFALLGVASAALTLVIVHSALVRLQLYDEVFGLTRLRYFSTAVAWWLAAVFVLVGLAMALTATRVAGRNWLLSAIGCSAVVMVVLLNLANPDRVIVEHNVERAMRGEEFDVAYARMLSSDATPVLVDLVPSLGAVSADAVRAEVCGPERQDEPTGWNLALWRAEASVARLCD